jgi:hypothetical protein
MKHIPHPQPPPSQNLFDLPPKPPIPINQAITIPSQPPNSHLPTPIQNHPKLKICLSPIGPTQIPTNPPFPTQFTLI